MQSVLIVILTLVVLIILHELGHFLLARRYNAKVDEFGIGIPPRIWGKKIGETIYSINWIPLGGFVKIHGENQRIDDERSFSSKPLYQRALIIFGGVAAFFLIAIIIFSLTSFMGMRVAIDDSEEGLWDNPQVMIIGVVEGLPAIEAGIMPGDIIKTAEGEKVTKIKEVQDILQGKELVELEIMRGKEVLFFEIISQETEEGKMIGIEMARTAKKSYPAYSAPWQGVLMTARMTRITVSGFYHIARSLISEGKVPADMQLGGPVRIIDIGAGAAERGLSDYLYFIGVITVSLAVINSLPIPALDGGRLLFLGIEKLKGGPISQKIEYKLNTAFFFLLLFLIIILTYYDIQGR